MGENLKYETYLSIGTKKIIISVITDDNKKIYEDEISLNYHNKIDLLFKSVDEFLNDHIFKIEKKIKGFVKKIFVIIDSSDLFNLKLSIKERNYENSVTQKSLNHLLYEAKESCKKTLYQKKILHMIIDNYNFDNKVFTSLPKNLDCNSFSLDLSFVCISDNFVKELEKILSRYQITLSQVVYEGYVRTFLDNQNKDLFLMAKKVIEGCNSNEVIFTSKAIKNEGFFEKFFNFFS